MSDLCYAASERDRILRQSELMDRMLAEVGADRASAQRMEDGAAWYAARVRCIDCEHVDACLGWLGRHDGARSEPGFCPNLELFQSCRGEGR